MTLVIAAGLIACPTASAQIGVDFRSAVKQRAGGTVAVKLDADPSPRFMMTPEPAIYQLPKAVPKTLTPVTGLPKKEAGSPARSGFVVAENLVISCQLPQDEGSDGDVR
jgi:hypothetical protein